MPKRTRGYVVGRGRGVIKVDNETKASRSSTAGVLSVIETHADGGASPHMHTREDEAFYILEGRIKVTIGENTWLAGPQSFVYLPRGVPHAFDVVGKSVRMLIITVPAGFDGFLREFDRAKDQRARDRVSRKYGIRWLAPAE